MKTLCIAQPEMGGDRPWVFELSGERLSSKHGTLPMCWFNVGPASQTVGQHWTDTWSMFRVCWVTLLNHTFDCKIPITYFKLLYAEVILVVKRYRHISCCHVFMNIVKMSTNYFSYHLKIKSRCLINIWMQTNVYKVYRSRETRGL